MSARRDPLAALIEADKSVADPDEPTLRRVWSSIETGVASGSPGPVLDTKPLLAPASGLGLKVLGLALLAALTGAAIVAATHEPEQPRRALAPKTTPLRAPETAPEPAPAPLPLPLPLPEPEAAPDPTPEPAPARRRRTPAPRAPRIDPSPAPAPGLADELALMRRIARALASADAQTAASLVKRHRQRFPDGALQEERAAAEVRIACLRDDASAQKRRAAFERRWPKSMHAAAIEAACGD